MAKKQAASTLDTQFLQISYEQLSICSGYSIDDSSDEHHTAQHLEVIVADPFF